MSGSSGSRIPESLARVGTFYVASRADWQAWLDSNGEETRERSVAPKRVLRGWSAGRAKVAARYS
ncbi:MAG: hypothetical protein H7834_09260 [Magnetococcus sp. YQC-9]